MSSIEEVKSAAERFANFLAQMKQASSKEVSSSSSKSSESQSEELRRQKGVQPMSVG